MWVKQCHKAPIWELFIPTIYGDLGDGFICVLPALLVRYYHIFLTTC